MNKFALPSRYIENSRNVWIEYGQMAMDYDPLDLGHGCPDFAPPDHIINALRMVSTSNNVLIHQYTSGFGHPRLVAALSKLYSPLVGKNICPQTEILIGSGAQEVLFSTIIGHVDSGDEVILIEPFFDCYVPMVELAGGTPKFIPLRLSTESDAITANDWILDPAQLENAFNEKTKLIIVNTPNNPLGKVFTQEELESIAQLCKKWNVVCISDEVYEWIVYEPHKHIRISSLPGMWERTITIGSAGKTFSITGWRIGWAYGPRSLIRNLQVVHQNCVYICNTPIQEAIAIIIENELNRFEQDDCYFKVFTRELKIKRDFIISLLSSVGMKPVLPAGGCFILADWSPLEKFVDLSTENDRYKDYRFTKWMIKNVGVQGIPTTAFYNEPNKYLGENFVRYCFIKKDEKLKQVADVLTKWRNQIK